MSIEKLQDSVDDLSVTKKGNMMKIQFGDLSTNWMASDDPFVARISPENLNSFFLEEHLAKEMEIKNVLDDGTSFLAGEKYGRAIGCFDEVICYDGKYSQALIGKSHALYGQGHFVKALRYYKRSDIDDKDYYRLLLKKSSEERDNFPKIKKNIYAGDEATFKGEYLQALDFYDKALINPSKFKNKILFKLLNKKAFVLIKLSRFDEALATFDASIGVHKNDSAYYGRGYCQYRLGLECVESLDIALKIDKKRILKKALIFNDLGLYEKSLSCINDFLNNHFKLDDDFRAAILAKIVAQDGLSLDSSHENEISKHII